uniref:uncharacterized protein LOC122607447 n=1 Tax=Erigeron canadensis TaxID=72917 RepID=UPI001CB90A89|nr:uncharacterized protein LOC122607447 [Erigeron canadensis]
MEEESQEAPPPKEYISSSLTLRTRMNIVNEIARALTPRQKELFQGTCFGPWLQLQQTRGDPALTHLFLQLQPIGIQRGEQEFWFYFPPFHYARFGREEFCLVTGLRFGRHDSFGPYIQNIHGPLWVFNVFPGYNRGGEGLKVSDFEKVLQEGPSGRLSDIDFVRLCVILLVEVGFTGKQSTQLVSPDMLSLAENMEAWNMFPWGSYLW